MCISNNAIELQAYHFFEKIQENSIYNIVRVNFIGGTFLESDQKISLRTEFQDIETIPLIKELILQTKAGKQFIVEPDELGLQFAKGDLCYKEYLLAKKDNSGDMLWYTSASTVFFTTMAWAFINYFQ